MKKRFISIFLLTVMLLCACGQKTPSPAPDTTQEWDVKSLAEALNQKATPKNYKDTSPMSTEVVTRNHIDDPLPPHVYKYFIRVNLQTNTLTVYAKDSGGEYTVPYLSMLCSTGIDTPTSGTYHLPGNHWPWLSLQGNVYGQYVTQIVGNILFHSVPYMELFNKGSLETEEFNKLGTSASLGCVRLQICDAKWIYDNCADVEAVEFYSDSDPGPLGWPSTPPYLDPFDERSTWDPSDPDAENPWNAEE